MFFIVHMLIKRRRGTPCLQSTLPVEEEQAQILEERRLIPGKKQISIYIKR